MAMKSQTITAGNMGTASAYVPRGGVCVIEGDGAMTVHLQYQSLNDGAWQDTGDVFVESGRYNFTGNRGNFRLWCKPGNHVSGSRFVAVGGV